MDLSGAVGHGGVRSPCPTRWTLTVTFDPLAVQAEADHDLAFPNDELSWFVGLVSRTLGTTVEELQEVVKWQHRTAWVHADELDFLVGLTSALMMYTIPCSLSVVRNESR